MNTRLVIYVLTAISLLLLAGCNEGINDWNSSASITGYVFTGPDHTTGIPGVQVIFESDINADNPYTGPDRWTSTNQNGYFEGAVFLGRDVDKAQYNYIADMSVGYFIDNKVFHWTGGVTVSPGSHFTLPPVDTTLFTPIGGQ